MVCTATFNSRQSVNAELVSAELTRTALPGGIDQAAAPFVRSRGGKSHPSRLQVSVKTGAANPENLRRAQPVSIVHLQNFLDVDLAHLVE